jgi:glucuronoarabinoxylan endo-1,4-beta-xylanase
MSVMVHTRLQKDVRAWTRAVISVVMLQGMVLLPQLRAQGANEAVIYLDSLQQAIRGFGAANILLWRPEMTASEIQKAFGTGTGEIGFSLLRLRIPPDAGGFAVNVANAQAAHAMGVTVIASPWSPPASMKTNNNIVGGRLREDAYASYAAHLKSFVDFMASNGVPIHAISVQNEPDIQVSYESCDWNATEMLKFVKEHGNSVGTKLIAPESFNFNATIANAILNDSAAAAHVDIIGGHIYGTTPTSYPLAAQKGKELWMTEYLINSGNPPTNLSIDTGWTGGLQTARSIHHVMNAGMNAYIWWYLVRYYGPIDDGTLGGVAASVTKKGYVMSQYARFIRPGFVRVLVQIPRSPLPVYLTAYKSGSKVVIVALNTGPSSIDQPISIRNIAGTITTLTPYVTSKTKNCEEQSDIVVLHGSFTATLPDSSVTTFVGDVVVSVADEGSRLPQTFELFQNYPNPFNPVTVIRFQLPAASLVSLNVYDLLGRKVASLVHGMMEHGYHNTEWNARAAASGLYFYRLEATTIGNPQTTFVETRKMLLVR